MDTPLTAKAALLQALTSGPGYGLELMERVEDLTGGGVSLHQGSVYPALRALEREGLVKSFDGETTPERRGRPRRYYELTAAGARAATEQRTALMGLLEPVGRSASGGGGRPRPVARAEDRLMTEPQSPRLHRSALSIAKLGDADDARDYWLQRSPQERLAALEVLRGIVYGYGEAPPRLQRVLAVAELEGG